MADYIRREVTPLLPGIGAPTLEAIVGELEIAVECRAADLAVGRRSRVIRALIGRRSSRRLVCISFLFLHTK